MRLNLPKPMHGWRAFAGEVGIIVLGVLLALGAQQFVEDMNWRQDVRQTRKAIDAESSHNLAALRHRLNQRPCVAERLAELDRWARTIGAGKPLRLKKPIQPPIYFAVRTAVWDSTSGEVSSRMPLEAKLDYAALYGAMKTFADLLNDEQTQWSTLESYQENRDLDRRELHEIRAAITSLRADNEILDVFQVRSREFGAKLGVSAEQGIDKGLQQQVASFNRKLCAPLL